MIYGIPSVVTAATLKPVSIQEVKDHLRIDTDDQDIYLSRLIDVATDAAQTYTRRTLLTTTYDIYFDCFGKLEIPLPPLQSVTSITYTDTDGNSQTVTSTIYDVDTVSTPGIIRLAYNQTWPSDIRTHPQTVVVRCVEGYTAASLIPEQIRQGILLTISEMHEHREESIVGVGVATAPMLRSAESLWHRYRVHAFG